MTATTDDGARLRKRLTRCFRETFGDALPEDVAESRMDTVEGWDSMATWTLLMLVQEQFGITIGLDQIPNLTSFSAFETYVARKLG